MKILVVGATGVLGGLIARRLLDQGRDVRVLVREGSDYQGLLEAGAEPVLGDLKDPASLRRACEGMDVVVSTANSARRGGPDTPETVEMEGNGNLVNAAREAGVQQFVFVSALGASEESPIPFMRGKAMTERRLRESGVPFTILQPNIFMDLWIPMLVTGPILAGQPVRLYGQAQRRHSIVAVEDVAAFAVAAIGNPAALGQTIVIGGPLAVSWREVVDTCERVLGHPVEVQSLAAGETLPGLPETVSHLAMSFEAYDSPIDSSAAAETFRVRLTPVEDVVRRALAT